MDITVYPAFLPDDDPEASLAFYRDRLIRRPSSLPQK